MRSFVFVYAAVIAYFAVALTAVSSLPPFLMEITLRAHPDASPDELAVLSAKSLSACTLSNGVLAVAVAGWAGTLSDHVGRRLCAALPALGQAAGMAILSLTAHLELDWRFALVGYAMTGALGGSFVFLASAFAYMADWTKAAERSRAFAGLEGIMLYVSAAGPLAAPHLVATVGFAGMWATCAGVYAIAALLFALAPPSPQPATPPLPCASWLAAFTPVLVARLACERGVRVLAAGFLLALSGLQGGLFAYVLYSQRFLGWGESQLGTFIASFSFTGGTFVLANTVVLPRVLRARGRAAPADLTVVRCAYLAPLLYLLLLAFAPSPEHSATWGMPLLGLGATALPHFRACFSAARPAERQGETLMLVAALESIPQLSAAPLAALCYAALIGRPRLVFLLAALCLAAAIALLWLGLRPAALRRRDSAASPALLHAEAESPSLRTAADDAVPVVAVVPAARHLSFAE